MNKIDAQLWSEVPEFIAQYKAYQMLSEVAINYDVYSFPKCLDITGPCNHPNCPLYDAHGKTPRWCYFKEYADKYEVNWTYDEEGNSRPC